MPAKRDISPADTEEILEHQLKVNKRLVRECTAALETLKRIDRDKLRQFSPKLTDIIEEAMGHLVPF